MMKWALLLDASIQLTFKVGIYISIVSSFVVACGVLKWELIGRIKEDPSDTAWIRGLVTNIKPFIDRILSQVNVEEALLHDIENQNNSNCSETNANSQPVNSHRNSPQDVSSHKKSEASDTKLNDENLEFYYKNLQEIVSNGCMFTKWVTLGIFGIGIKSKLFKDATEIYYHLVVYVVIGCVSFNLASCMKKNIWFVCLVCLACSMQTAIWETVLFHFFWKSPIMPWLILIGSTILSAPLVS